MLPFILTPSAWFLRGTNYEIAEINHNFTGREREIKLAEIDYRHDQKAEKVVKDIELKYQNITEYEYAIWKLKYDDKENEEEILNLKLQYNKISSEEYEREITKLQYTGVEQEIALAELDLKQNKIDEKTYEKTVATLKNEPWIGIKNDGYDPKQGVSGLFFEFDWNNQWISYLKENGYRGQSDEEIVEKWFQDTCRAVIMDEISEGFPWHS